MSKKKKILIWLSVVLVILIIATFYVFLPKKDKVEYTTASAEKGSLVQTVSVTGDLVDKNEITLNFELGGRVKEIFVKEGDSVAQGEVIASIEDENLNLETEKAKAVLDKTVADSKNNDDLLREAGVTEENAEEYLDETKDLNKQNIAAAQQAVKNAEDYYDSAKELYEDSPTKTNKLTLVSAENSLKAAKESKKTAEAQADLSEVSAESSLNSASSKKETLESEYAERSRDASVENARANYDIAPNNLSKASLKSPINGLITEINNKKGEVLGSGVIKESFTKIISNDLIIESKIPESDIVKIKKGMAAKASFDALPNDEIFSCSVVEINPAETVVQDVVYYKVKFKLDNVDSRLKPGMSSDINIETARKDGVLFIPQRALKNEDGHKYVELLKDDKEVVKVEVTTGIEGDEGMIEIKSGIKEGEKVITFVKTN